MTTKQQYKMACAQYRIMRRGVGKDDEALSRWNAFAAMIPKFTIGAVYSADYQSRLSFDTYRAHQRPRVASWKTLTSVYRFYDTNLSRTYYYDGMNLKCL